MNARILATVALVAAEGLYRPIGGGGGGGGITQLTGDVLAGPGSGAVPATVARINGATVPAAGALTTGNVLQVTGTSALGYAAVNLAGGANFVTGLLPVANIAPAGTNGFVLTTTGGATVWAAASGGSGITQLTGDVTAGPGSGSQAATVVQARAGEYLFGAGGTMTWATSASPILTQAVTASTAPAPFVVSPQASSGSTGNGSQFLVQLSIPNGAGTQGIFQVQVPGSNTTLATIGPWSSAPTDGAMWLTVAPNASNMALLSNGSGDTFLNSSSALFFSIAVTQYEVHFHVRTPVFQRICCGFWWRRRCNRYWNLPPRYQRRSDSSLLWPRPQSASTATRPGSNSLTQRLMFPSPSGYGGLTERRRCRRVRLPLHDRGHGRHYLGYSPTNSVGRGWIHGQHRRPRHGHRSRMHAYADGRLQEHCGDRDSLHDAGNPSSDGRCGLHWLGYYVHDLRDKHRGPSYPATGGWCDSGRLDWLHHGGCVQLSRAQRGSRPTGKANCRRGAHAFSYRRWWVRNQPAHWRCYCRPRGWQCPNYGLRNPEHPSIYHPTDCWRGARLQWIGVRARIHLVYDLAGLCGTYKWYKHQRARARSGRDFFYSVSRIHRTH